MMSLLYVARAIDDGCADRLTDSFYVGWIMLTSYFAVTPHLIYYYRGYCSQTHGSDIVAGQGFSPYNILYTLCKQIPNDTTEVPPVSYNAQKHLRHIPGTGVAVSRY